jgi:uncharacterized membrane protein
MAERPCAGNVSNTVMGMIRRIVKTLLWSLAAIVALLVLVVGGLWAYAAIDKEDTFVLQIQNSMMPITFGKSFPRATTG